MAKSFFIVPETICRKANFLGKNRKKEAFFGRHKQGPIIAAKAAGETHFFNERRMKMEFFNSAVTVLQTLVIALGAGLGIWGAVNLLEGYGNDNPGANAHVR